MKTNSFFIIVAISLATITSLAAELPSLDQNLNSGIIYGEGHVFIISAPKGWVLDNKSGVKQGLYAVFYPNGSNWEKSPVVMYVNTIKREPNKTLATFIKDDIEEFQQKGPNLHVTTGKPITISEEKTAEVRIFTGDQWGNYESVAYIDEPTIFVTIVLSSRQAAPYENSKKAFEDLVKSYFFITTDVHMNSFEAALKVAEENIKTPEGKNYDSAIGMQFADKHAPTMQRCTRGVDKSELAPFDILMRIRTDGVLEDVLVKPETKVATCLQKELVKTKFANPPKPSYWVHITMKITN